VLPVKVRQKQEDNGYEILRRAPVSEERNGSPMVGTAMSPSGKELGDVLKRF
jgi:hypothetical protein